MHVPQAGNEKLAPAVDNAGIGWYARARRRAGVGDSVAGNDDGVIRACCARGDVNHRDVGDRDCFLPGGCSGAGRPQEGNRDYRTPYLVRLTRQFPVCGAFNGEPLVLNVPSIVSPFTVPVKVVTTGQSHWGSR